jgi:sugar lactone lactonase YvrE
LDLAGHTLNVYGNWTNSGGTLVTNGGTINFVGTSTQTILGQNTFENLTKTSNTQSALLFDGSATTTITGNLILQGSSGNELSIGIPMSNSVYTYVDSIGPGFIGSAGMAVDNQNNFYFIEQGGRVQKYSSNPNSLLTINGSFCGPRNIAVNSSGNIYVSDFCSQIKVFDPLGNKIAEIGTMNTPSSADGQFNTPTGLAFDSSDNLFVMDRGNYRVEKFDSNNNYVSKLNYSSGSGSGQFSSDVNGMAIDSQGNIYIVDSGNARVEEFDSGGTFVRAIGSSGPNAGQFYYPTAIGIDSSDNIFVTDSGKNNVQKFDSNGNFMTVFGTYGPNAGELNSPWGITIDHLGYVYISNESSSYIDRFFVPPPSNLFNILFTDTSTPSFSYLNVTGSTNLSSQPFSCLTGCINGGGNTNWIFPSSGGGSRSSSQNTQLVSTTSAATFSSLRISPTNPSVFVGSTTQFISTIMDQYGNSLTTQTYWSSSNILVGKIGSIGLFTAISPGTTIISGYTGTSLIATTTVTVVTIPLAIIAISSATSSNISNVEINRIPETFCFTKNLFPGPLSDCVYVYRLQMFLNDHGFTVSATGTGSYNNESWYYGPLTTAAVKTFQESYSSDILAPLGFQSGTGFFGNYTRKKANDLLGTGCVTYFEITPTSTPKEIATTTATTTEKIATTTIPEVVALNATTTAPEVPAKIEKKTCQQICVPNSD